jgi:hypothetical protein
MKISFPKGSAIKINLLCKTETNRFSCSAKNFAKVRMIRGLLPKNASFYPGRVITIVGENNNNGSP